MGKAKDGQQIYVIYIDVMYNMLHTIFSWYN